MADSVSAPRIDLRPVDLHDEALLRQWWEVGRAAGAERPYDAWPAWQVTRVMLPARRSDHAVELLAAHDRGQMVGSALIGRFLLENTHLATIDVYVRPKHRRRGTGSLLLEESERIAGADGRSTLLSAAHAPLGGESPGSLFATVHGYEVVSEEESKLLDLPKAAATWGTLQDEVDAARGDHSYVVFDGPCPDGLVEGYCALLSVFFSSIPGEIDMADADWTPERLRAREQELGAVGRITVTCLALTGDGRVVGFSDARLNQADPSHGTIGGTLVLPEHRGHRLGLGMKLATHRALLARFPGCRTVETGNASLNAAMNAVNESMGYRVLERALDVQKSPGKAALASITPGRAPPGAGAR